MIMSVTDALNRFYGEIRTLCINNFNIIESMINNIVSLNLGEEKLNTSISDGQKTVDADIVVLYDSPDKTNAICPKTKTSAVVDENGKTLDTSLSEISTDIETALIDILGVGTEAALDEILGV